MEFPNIQGFSIRNLKYMKKIALEYQDFEFVQEVLAQITWYHNVILMDKVKDMEERKLYIRQTVEKGWSTNYSTERSSERNRRSNDNKNQKCFIRANNRNYTMSR